MLVEISFLWREGRSSPRGTLFTALLAASNFLTIRRSNRRRSRSIAMVFAVCRITVYPGAPVAPSLMPWSAVRECDSVLA
jgi:hypothetical protein